jgi:hypothetical protein
MEFVAQAKKLKNMLKGDGTIDFGKVNLDKMEQLEGLISVKLIKETLWLKYQRASTEKNRNGYISSVREYIRRKLFTEEEFITNAFRVARVQFRDVLEEKKVSLGLLGLSPEGIYY